MGLQPLHQFAELVGQRAQRLGDGVLPTAEAQHAAVDGTETGRTAGAHHVAGAHGQRLRAIRGARFCHLQFETPEPDHLCARVDAQDPDHRHRRMVASAARAP